MAHLYLAIEGVIGVGKTTLARLLQPRLDSELLLEAFDRNPFLSDFYSDRSRYAFQTQMFFLLSRYRQGQTVPRLLEERPVIADYIFAKDSLFAHLNLAGDELEMYERLYDALAEQMLLPNLVIYLRASTDVLMARIATRDRSYERSIDRAYIESLRQAYDHLFSQYVEAPVLVIDTNDLDFVRDPKALDFIEGQLRTELRHGQYQQMLPQMESVSSSLAVEFPEPGRVKGPSSRAAVEAYLRASAAMGRLGALLAETASSEQREVPRGQLSEVVRDLAAQLRRFSQAMDVDVRDGTPWPK